MKNNTFSYFTRLRFDVSAKDWILSVFSITPAVILFNYWLFGTQYFEDLEEFLIVTLFTIFAAILLWAILMHVMYAIRRKYPSLKQTWSRIKLSLLLYSTLTIAFSFIVMHIYDMSGLYGFQYTNVLFIKVVGICIIINLFSEGAYEFFYTFEKWK